MSESQPSHTSEEVYQRPEVAIPTFDKPPIPIDITKHTVDVIDGEDTAQRLASLQEELEKKLGKFKVPRPPHLLRALDTVRFFRMAGESAETPNSGVLKTDDGSIVYPATAPLRSTECMSSIDGAPPIDSPRPVEIQTIPGIGDPDAPLSLVTATHQQQLSGTFDLTDPATLRAIREAVRCVDIPSDAASNPSAEKIRIFELAIINQLQLNEADEQNIDREGLKSAIRLLLDKSLMAESVEFETRLLTAAANSFKAISGINQETNLTVPFPDTTRTWIGLGDADEGELPPTLINATGIVQYREGHKEQLWRVLEVLTRNESGEYEAEVTCRQPQMKEKPEESDSTDDTSGRISNIRNWFKNQ